MESWGLFVNFLQLLRGWASGPVKSRSGMQPWLPARPRRLYLEQDNSLQTQDLGPTLQSRLTNFAKYPSSAAVTRIFTCLSIRTLVYSFHKFLLAPSTMWPTLGHTGPTFVCVHVGICV